MSEEFKGYDSKSNIEIFIQKWSPPKIGAFTQYKNCPSGHAEQARPRAWLKSPGHTPRVWTLQATHCSSLRSALCFPLGKVYWWAGAENAAANPARLSCHGRVAPSLDVTKSDGQRLSIWPLSEKQCFYAGDRGLQKETNYGCLKNNGS